MTFSERAVEAAAKAISRMVPCSEGGRWSPNHGHDFPNEYFDDEQKLIRAMAAEALSAALAVDGLALQGWRTIDSAPKDGRYILLGRFCGSELRWVKHSRWMTAEDAAEQENGLPDDYDAGWTDGEDESDYCYGATHWQPLPAPPLTAASDGEVG